ncbi:hypothetical protein HanRHA438_Chr12g0532851 [Helianthus annuus]|nr:hypothetical protein HanRHA438_Chr12g0532851 [Helianthus annuus]
MNRKKIDSYLLITTQLLNIFFLIFPVSTAPSNNGSTFFTSSTLIKRKRSLSSMYLVCMTILNHKTHILKVRAHSNMLLKMVQFGNYIFYVLYPVFVTIFGHKKYNYDHFEKHFAVLRKLPKE